MCELRRSHHQCEQLARVTVLTGGGDPYYNWLTQSRLDSVDYVSSSSIDSSQSSLLFTVGRGGPASGARHVKQPPVGPDFGKHRLGHGTADTDQPDGAGMLTIISMSFLFCHNNCHCFNISTLLSGQQEDS